MFIFWKHILNTLDYGLSAPRNIRNMIVEANKLLQMSWYSFIFNCNFFVKCYKFAVFHLICDPKDKVEGQNCKIFQFDTEQDVSRKARTPTVSRCLKISIIKVVCRPMRAGEGDGKGETLRLAVNGNFEARETFRRKGRN